MPFFRKHKVLSSLLLLLIVVFVLVAWRSIGPYRSYRVDLAIPDNDRDPVPGVLEVGVAKRDITPDLSRYDSWIDADNDGRYDEHKGDSWQDTNGNGRRDLVWLAGFSSNRPAKGVHDPLWARAVAFRNNGVTLVMVTIDSIGILHEKFIAVRKSLDPALGIDHAMFSSLHNHESPDTMGIWSNIDGVGAALFASNFDHAYIELVQRACKEAAEEAVRNLAPADMFIAQAEIEPEGFVDDSRLPHVYDTKICCARFVKHGTYDTIATLVSWGNHVETLGSKNSIITSDFPHYLREGLERGVAEPNGIEGFGGMCLYFQGMLGGLMTQLHTTVPHRDGVQKFREDSFEKAQALGENVALVAAKALRGEGAARVENPKVAAVAKTIFAPVDGLFGWAILFGLIHPGWYWGKARTEINAFRIGDLEILTIPGEIYPEICEGGVESPEGADFPGPPVEVPPLRRQMRGKVNMVFNLANDEIGYIVPKTQWDVRPPFAYGREKAQYGEENSPGPEVAPVIHREALAVLERLHAIM